MRADACVRVRMCACVCVCGFLVRASACASVCVYMCVCGFLAFTHQRGSQLPVVGSTRKDKVHSSELFQVAQSLKDWCVDNVKKLFIKTNESMNWVVNKFLVRCLHVNEKWRCRFCSPLFLRWGFRVNFQVER